MAKPSPWILERIGRQHDRESFHCGLPELDRFLRRYARQNDERGFGRTSVAVESGRRRVLGFFTIRAGSVRTSAIPPEVAARLPQYPVPVVHLARLAVDETMQRRGLGEWLLVRALERTSFVAEHLGVTAVETIAKDDRARSFYERYGSRSLPQADRRLFLSVAEIRAALER